MERKRKRKLATEKERMNNILWFRVLGFSDLPNLLQLVLFETLSRVSFSKKKDWEQNFSFVVKLELSSEFWEGGSITPKTLSVVVLIYFSPGASCAPVVTDTVRLRNWCELLMFIYYAWQCVLQFV